jgi:adenylyl-sulfate kinase
MNEAGHNPRNFKAGCVVWLTGLSGAGKSTIAEGLKHRLSDMGRHAFVLDGDLIRRGLCSDLAFSPSDRTENVRRIGEVSKLFAEAGLICIVALISPYLADRNSARNIIGAGRFIEVYVNAPLAVCERRDPKGLYARARASQLKEFTGVTAPYEPPVHPEVELRTNELNATESIGKILEYLSGAQ